MRLGPHQVPHHCPRLPQRSPTRPPPPPHPHPPRSGAFHNPPETAADAAAAAAATGGKKKKKKSARLEPQCVEPWARDLRQIVIRHGIIKGRVFQSLGYHHRAQHELRATLRLARGYVYVMEELAKCLMAQGEYLEARNMLYACARRVCPRAYRTRKDQDEDDPTAAEVPAALSRPLFSPI